jgi:tetratricopeptide (TPR) repeat protein
MIRRLRVLGRLFSYILVQDEGGISVTTRASLAKFFLLLALISFSVPAAPSMWAQEEQWDKHMKAGGKAYNDGMKQKYLHGWGDAGPNSQFAKAEEEFLAALGQTQTFPAGDIRTAETLGALATVYMEEGKYADAESKGNQAIALMDAAAKPGDVRLGYALIHLALIYDSEGKTAEAAPIWQRSLDILKDSGGIDPSEMSNLNFHATFIQRFHPAASAQIYQYIVDLKESTGVSDSDLRSELARLARTQRGADAEQDYLRILEIDKRLYGPDDIKTGGDQEALGSLYLHEGKYKAALPCLQRSLEIMQAKPSPEHESKLGKRFDASDLLLLERDLAQAYAGAGNDAEAEAIYKRIISADETDSMHDKVANQMSLTDDLIGLSGVYRDQHRYDEALDIAKRSEAIDEEIANSKFGKSKEQSSGPSIWLWLSQIELAEIYREKGDVAAAEPLFQSSLEMTQHMHLAPGHPKLAQMLDNYATLLRDGGKYEQAEALYERSIETWAKCLYPENADAAETLKNYAVLLRKTNRPAEAEPLEARASAILTKIGAPNLGN